MDLDYPSPMLTLLLFLVIVFYIYILRKRSQYPAGPWPLPIIGNLHLLSGVTHHAFTRLSKQYGPVFTLWMGNDPTVVISGLQLSKDAMNDASFAGRNFRSPFTKIVTENNRDLVTRPLDEKAKLMRKVALSAMKSTMGSRLNMTTIVQQEVRHFLADVEKKSGSMWDPSELISRVVKNNIMMFIYGTRYEAGDPIYKKWERLQQITSEGTIGGLITEVFPFLARFKPYTRRLYNESCELSKSLHETYLREHEETFNENNIRDLTDMMIQAKKELDKTNPSEEVLSRTNIRLLASNLIFAGTEATHGTLLWCLLLLLRNPDTKERVQRELDTFVSRKTTASNNAQGTPTYNHNNNKNNNNNNNGSPPLHISIADREHLPMLNALIYEILRICPLAPLSVPHKTMKDAKLQSYIIPKDTMVVFNFYGVNMNPLYWDNPNQFNVDRFLKKNGTLDLEKTKNVMAFGLGKRSCLGENLARTIFFEFLSNLLLHFDLISPPGEKLPSIDDGIYSLAFLPKPFRLQFQKRRQLVGQRYNN